MKILILLSFVFASQLSLAISHLKSHEINASRITLWQTTYDGMPAFIQNPKPEVIIYNLETKQITICDKNIFVPFTSCDRKADSYLSLAEYLVKYHSVSLESVSVKTEQKPAWIINGQTIYTLMADISLTYKKIDSPKAK
jgi:hypothetical protein